MRTFRVLLSVVAVAAAAGWTWAGSTTARITYVTGTSVYVGAGERDGVVPGTRFETAPESGGAVLVARETSPGRAVCDVTSGEIAGLTAGDEVRFAPVARLAPAQAGAPSGRRPAGVRGRIGLRYLATRDGLNDRAEFSSPGIDLRLDAPALYGSPWNLHVDVRARRITRTTVDGSDLDDDRSKVYRLTAGWDPAGPGWRFAAGRQLAPELANVSIFDGASVAWDGERISAGGFAGTQPDGMDWGYSSDIREGGGWIGYRSAPSAARRWSLYGGAVASRQDGEINREFAFLQARYSGGRLRAYATQEVDFNRDWKKDEAGESSLEPTSTFVSVRVKATDAIDFHAGFDNRRNVRLFRDRVTPATEFDDEFRRGAWVGARARAGRHLRFGASARRSSGGSAGDADSITLHAAAVRLTRFDVRVSGRATTWDNDRLEGDLFTAEVAVHPVPGFGIALLGGTRDETSLLNPALDDSVSWAGLDLDLDLPGRVWATLSFERAEGDFEEVDQLYATLAWRF